MTTANVARGFAVNNGFAPKGGPVTLPVRFDFTNTDEIVKDFLLEITEGVINFIQTVYVDNTDNPEALEMIFDVTQQRIVVPATAQGFFPVITTTTTKVVARTTGGAIVHAQFMNVPMPAMQYGPTTINIPTINVAAITPGDYADFSGTIGAGGVSEIAIPANPARLSFFIQNPPDAIEVLYVNFGSSASNGDSIVLAPGQIFPPNASPFISTQDITVMADTTGHVFIAKENV